MFSASGIQPVTSTCGLSAATASSVPSTAAAPLMSLFIASMPDAGLMEMPPLSNVMPLPTTARCRLARGCR